MLKYIKSNFPIIVLIFIVVGGFAYPFYSGEWIIPSRLGESDAKCYNVDVPSTIKYNQVELFCSCIHSVQIEDKQEKYKYCANKLNK